MNLRELQIGQSARITNVGGEGALRQHFLDMGVIPGAEITLIKYAPMGDPMELQIHGYELTLRLSEAEKIDIELIDKRTNAHDHISKINPSAHPGIGEDGVLYHNHKEDKPVIPDDEVITFALVGNQNCGKTTLFNQLTGSNQHVGNFPGVTIDRKDGQILNHPNTLITDLPGIYSMSPYTSEEIVSRDFVLKDKPKAIINIVDATNIERNLYLSMQLLEMNIPMVIALNMMDELRENNGVIDINTMEKMLGVPVVPISAAKNEGVKELIDHAIHVARYHEVPQITDFCKNEDHGGAIHRAIHSVENLIEDHALNNDLPLRFAATKVLEDDELIIEQLRLDDHEKEMLEHIALQMENESTMDRSAAIADMRFDYIERVAEASVYKPQESKQRIRSEKIDKILTGKYTAIPIFILIMASVFYLTFNVIGLFFQDLLDAGISWLAEMVDIALTNFGVSDILHGLIIEGIFEGVGSVLSFLPIVVTLFFFLSLMEDSGYIARVAFFMDKLLRKIGLSGRSIVPMLIGFGCTVPAVMSTRTLPSKRDRHLTILLTPFMSCTAKLPIYAFFVNAFFKEYSGLIMTGLYLLGIVMAIIVALVFKNTMFKGEAVPFCMELPNYRTPSAKNVLQLMWDKAKDFISRAFSIILVATIVVWLLQSVSIHFELVDDSSQSIMATIANILVPLFKPIGLGDWRIVTALISGFMAKESVVTTMGVLFSGSVETSLPAISAACLLIFSLLYTPCVAAIAAIKRELGGKEAISVVVFQCVLAWFMTFIVYILLNGIL
ncbi:MAG: ferrous iron transport protein B [Erysipelotrichaceae bacterium]|nr:ferrous iron transport protein B [Erysipelotrichaceae bacterium]